MVKIESCHPLSGFNPGKVMFSIRTEYGNYHLTGKDGIITDVETSLDYDTPPGYVVVTITLLSKLSENVLLGGTDLVPETIIRDKLKEISDEIDKRESNATQA